MEQNSSENIGHSGSQSNDYQQGSSSGKQWFSWKYITAAIAALILLTLGGFYLKNYMEMSDPKFYAKHYALGVEYFNKGLFDLATEELTKASKARPDSPDPYYGLGMVNLTLKKLDKSVQYFEKAVSKGPERMDIRYSLAVTYQRLDRLEKALEVYHEIARRDPQSYQVFSNVGVIQMKMGEPDKAEKALKHAIEIKPDYYPAYFNLAKVYESQGNLDLAKKELEFIRAKTSKRPETAGIAKAAEQRLALIKSLKTEKK